MTFLIALALIMAGIVVMLSARNNQTVVEYIRGLR